MSLASRTVLGGLAVGGLAFLIATFVLAQQPAGPADNGVHDHAIVLNYQKDLKWSKIVPELGNSSPEMAYLHVDPETNATTLMIRANQGMHVPKHWHSASESHIVLHGSFVLACDGLQRELHPGDFSFMPPQMVHEAWCQPDKEGFLLLITTDRAWDIHWVDGPITSKDLGQTLPGPSEP